MLWTYYRQGQLISYEIRLAGEGSGFELVVRFPDGIERIEKFEDSAALNRRALALEDELLGEGWWLAADPRR